MIHYRSQDLSKKQQYKFLSGSVIPRPIAWLTTQSKDAGVLNIAPFSFFSGVSNELPLLSIAILRRDGKCKDSARNILETKELVVHIVDETLVTEMNQTAASLAFDESELALTSLTTTPSKTVAVPSIAEANIRFEATLHQHIPVTNEDGQVITDLFLINVTDFYFKESVFDQERDYILSDKLQPVARLAGNQYATLKKEYTITRPE
ncbi:hypothetical protein CKN86_05940 [Carnobacterium divergens]|uniref:flavin reductase family protein n=1 Tax=Carnobacterium divergens TaxID=2748 RepID=UPI000D4AC4F8|nr:flavin reductase family protein [Carnobacterium divergens]MCO6017091.1 flavin reductase family protein [Carnobacterium divergens]TFI62379.1 hypothetical protein CKN62_05975 [Carnobacterium divergens]TFI89581.1 hypothetical protein CKN84_05975 [Carnobacterium divergens]TFJ04636.1 hypothetical protein CKN86_05940 [Carnobacterium divergens]TFJ06126.1 hypothetical protein CKN65_05980 [Carnobacterium divergens]